MVENDWKIFITRVQTTFLKINRNAIFSIFFINPKKSCVNTLIAHLLKVRIAEPSLNLKNEKGAIQKSTWHSKGEGSEMCYTYFYLFFDTLFKAFGSVRFFLLWVKRYFFSYSFCSSKQIRLKNRRLRKIKISHGEGGGVLKGPISVTYYLNSPKLKMAILHYAKDFTRKKYDYLKKLKMYFSIKIIKLLLSFFHFHIELSHTISFRLTKFFVEIIT